MASEDLRVTIADRVDGGRRAVAAERDGKKIIGCSSLSWFTASGAPGADGRATVVAAHAKG
jgi:hypothetical protein